MYRIGTWALAFSNILLPIAIVIFAKGFFPYKPFLPGFSPDIYANSECGWRPAAQFDKVILMVVDALRSDFVFDHGSGFTFTQSLIATGAALPFTAHATSPTITMPRIKAITTGSIPSFLDVILNFAESDTSSSLAGQDTWIAQLKQRHLKKLVMFGDDTWLKLFPGTFDRADGTTSFFVSDFTEVDNNVTRHITTELANDDWSGMVLHYLGLDHIGHKSGPRSVHMLPKQKEMDEVVQQIYEAQIERKHLNHTLLVLLGDHGMNDAGNHGGSSPGETSPALVFISPKFRQEYTGLESPTKPKGEYRYYSSVEQSDILPTLAGLLDFPISRNNLGVFIPEFLRFWDKDDHMNVLDGNYKQLLSILKTAYPSLHYPSGKPKDCADSGDSMKALGCQWLAAETYREEYEWQGSGMHHFRERQDSNFHGPMYTFLRNAQAMMSTAATNYDIRSLAIGSVLATLAFLVVLGLVHPNPVFDSSGHLRIDAEQKFSLGFQVGFVTQPPTLSAYSVVLITMLYGIMMFASSYVEEEQHFWYWILSAWIFYLYLKESRLHMIRQGILVLGALVFLRVARRWNQTGQKFAGEPDIARTFLPAHRFILWSLVATTYVELMFSMSEYGFRRAPMEVCSVVVTAICVASVGFKVAFTAADAPELLQGLPVGVLDGLRAVPLVAQASTVFCGIALALLYTLAFELKYSSPSKESKKTDPPSGPFAAPRQSGALLFIHDLFTLFLLTQTRLVNIPLFLIFRSLYLLLSNMSSAIEDTKTLSVTIMLLQHASFFALGNSNAISSVDLSNAYNGVASYNVVAVGVLTFVSNWAGPLWWCSAGNLLLVQQAMRATSAEKAEDADRPQKPTTIIWRPQAEHIALLTIFTTGSLATVMIACTVLRTHLFIWTVFSPKFLYEVAWALPMHLGGNIILGSFLFWIGVSSAPGTKLPKIQGSPDDREEVVPKDSGDSFRRSNRVRRTPAKYALPKKS